MQNQGSQSLHHELAGPWAGALVSLSGVYFLSETGGTNL